MRNNIPKLICLVLAVLYLSKAKVCLSSTEILSAPSPLERLKAPFEIKGLSAPWVKKSTSGLEMGRPVRNGHEALDNLKPANDRARLLLRLVDLGPAFPRSLRELAGDLYKKGLERTFDQTAAGLIDILRDRDRLVGTGIGYDIGRGMRLQGVGVFDMTENSGYLGPALRFRPAADIDLTTGMQVSVSEKSSTELKDFFFAEFRILF